jgi:predicted ester cyclase
MVAEGDRVVVWGVSHGTHRGDFMGIPATGKEIAVGWFSLFRFTPNGRIQEDIVALDQFSMLQQLGAIPAPTQSTA